MLLRVRLACTRGVVQMDSGCVGFVEVCGPGLVTFGKCSVSPLKIFASASNAVVCLPGFLASKPLSFRIASNRSLATLVAPSIGVSMGNSQYWGYSWYYPDVRILPDDGIWNSRHG